MSGTPARTYNVGNSQPRLCSLALHHGGADAGELLEHRIYLQMAGASIPQFDSTLDRCAESSYLRGQLYTECAGDLQYCIEPRFGTWRESFV